MKDIPVFTSEYGVASLILRDIPYTKEAHIRIQDSLQPQEFLEECVSFCRACGAETIKAAGHPWLGRYPLHTAIVIMRRSREGMPKTDAALFPVLPETLEQWRKIYNERMAGVPNVSWMSGRDSEELLNMKDAYFIHRNGQLLGIGRASGGTIDVVIAVQPGAGRDVVLALSTLITEDMVEMMVATANERAVRLYEKLGFFTVRELSRWYKII